MSAPLQGKTIFIPRAAKQAKEFAKLITQYGGNPLAIPLISFSPVEISHDKVKTLSSFDWVVLTSKNSVKYFCEYLHKLDVVDFPKFAVIGEKTNKALNEQGVVAQFIPTEFVAERFLMEFLSKVKTGESVLIPKGNLARSVIAEGLEQSGIMVEEWIVYENTMPLESARQLTEMLRSTYIDVLTFTSPSTVENFMLVIEKERLYNNIKNATVACIGPVTKQAAEKVGLTVHICPEVFTIEGLLEEIMDFFKK